MSRPGFGKDAIFEVTASGAPVAIINDTRSTFQLDDRSFSVRGVGILRTTVELKHAETVIATLRHKPFFNHYTLEFGGRTWTFKATTMLANRFGLFENETQAGTVSSGAYFSRLKDITADLPEELPREIQLFLLSIFISQLTAPST
jgi:hypothetical protein